MRICETLVVKTFLPAAASFGINSNPSKPSRGKTKMGSLHVWECRYIQNTFKERGIRVDLFIFKLTVTQPVALYFETHRRQSADICQTDLSSLDLLLVYIDRSCCIAISVLAEAVAGFVDTRERLLMHLFASHHRHMLQKFPKKNSIYSTPMVSSSCLQCSHNQKLRLPTRASTLTTLIFTPVMEKCCAILKKEALSRETKQLPGGIWVVF